MPNSYDVDDILEEIKRKKSAKAMPEQNTQRPRPTAWDRVESSASVNAPAAEQLQQASSLEGLADFFGSNAKFDIGTQDKKSPHRADPSRREPVQTPKTKEMAEESAWQESELFRTEQPKDIQDMPDPRREIHFDLEQWQQEEETPRQPILEKTQLNIPLSAVREPEEDEIENLEKHRKKAVDDGSTALIFTYKLITKNSDIY